MRWRRRPLPRGRRGRSTALVSTPIARGSGNVSATGPGPKIGPDGTPRASVVTGLDCSSHNCPVLPMAHSTSWGAPKTSAAASASSTRERMAWSSRIVPASSSRSRTAPRGSRRYREPATSPLTSGSGPPSTAVITRRPVRPDTGSTPKRTPPQRGSMSGWTRTAIGSVPPPTPARESRTVRTASTSSS